MTRLNFPATSESPYTENGITYTWVENGDDEGYWSASGEQINLQSVTDNGNVTDTRAGINATGTTAPIDSLCLPYIDTEDEERGIAWQRGAIDAARIVVHCEDIGFSRAASLRFKTMTANGAAAERFIIEHDGDVSIVDGNLVLDAGNGIDFSDTPGTGTSELFNDYEEGAWTPTIASTNTGNTLSVESFSQNRYTKIGDLVTLTTRISVNATTSGQQITIGETFFLSGQPFSINNRMGNGQMCQFNDSASNPARAAVFNAVSTSFGFTCVYKEGSCTLDGTYDLIFSYFTDE